MRQNFKPVQLSPETHAMLKQQAQAAHRSMAQHIQHLLERETMHATFMDALQAIESKGREVDAAIIITGGEPK